MADTSHLVPNRRSVVTEVFNRLRPNLLTKAGNGGFTEAVAWELEQREPGVWFHLKKVGGQNQWNGHAVDAILHAATGYAVDIIGSSESPDAAPAWHLDKKDDGSPRYAGRTDLQIKPFPPSDEPGNPPADTHRYDGGGNDTGTCDRCGQGRLAAIHAVPESKVPHGYDGGEQDTGLCDICAFPRLASIHTGGEEPPPPPPPTDDLKARVQALEATASAQAMLLREHTDAIARLTARLQVLEDAPEGELPAIVAEGTTGRVFGHSHPVRLLVRKL